MFTVYSIKTAIYKKLSTKEIVDNIYCFIIYTVTIKLQPESIRTLNALHRNEFSHSNKTIKSQVGATNQLLIILNIYTNPTYSIRQVETSQT